MVTKRNWAFWRRVQYGTGFGSVCFLLFLAVYMGFFYNPANCFDGRQNADELGVDCGGSCVRLCSFMVSPPTVQWARSFAVTDGQYNAVAYIENTNTNAASPAVPYTLTLYDAEGVIASRKGITVLPPDSVYPIFEARIHTNGRVPTQTFLELGEITMWVPASVGREQFVVNSRTLKGADAQPRLTAKVYNQALTKAEDVEVIATIFDAGGNALTASRTFVDEFLPRSVETMVFTWPQPIAKTIRSCEVPTDVAVVIDLSGSMNNDNDVPPEPVTSVLKAAEAFVSRLQSRDQVSLITFATEAAVVKPLSTDAASVQKTIRNLVIDPNEEQGSTNTGDALYRVSAELNSLRHNDEARKVAVLLTDGLATAPDEEPEAYALAAALAAKETGIELYTIGLGENVNMDFVRQLASSNQQAFQALSRAQVDTIYQAITAALCEDGPAVIEIIPKTTAGFERL